MCRSFLLLLTGSAWLCVPTMLHAQQAEPSAAPADDDIIVVTGYGRTDQPTAATGLPLSPLETPQTISVITRQQIDDQAFVSINDALDFTVGISKKDIDRGRSAISARGFEVQNFQLDGAPFENGNVGFGETSTAQYERVDLVRGAAGLMQGAGDPSAVVNLIRKHATEREFAGISALRQDRGTASPLRSMSNRRSTPPERCARVQSRKPISRTASSISRRRRAFSSMA
jgi:outer membrane receptor for ferric coprogen and ferric-rhodotorulic acid